MLFIRPFSNYRTENTYILHIVMNFFAVTLVSIILSTTVALASSPLDLMDGKSREQLEKKAMQLTSSLEFLTPESWNEEEFSLAYIAYCEGWNVEKNVEKGLGFLRNGYEKGLSLPTSLLADVKLNGYFDTHADFEAALFFYSKAYEFAREDHKKANLALKIAKAYEEHSNSLFAKYYAIPWLRLSLENGLPNEEANKIADLLTQFETETQVFDAGELIEEFKEGMIDYHKNHSGQVITVRGRVVEVSKGALSGKYTIKLLPENDAKSLLPGFLSGLSSLTSEDNEKVSSILKKASKGASLWNKYRNAVDCLISGNEAEALEIAEVIMIRGTYALGTGFLPKIKDCELYIEPPIKIPSYTNEAEGTQNDPAQLMPNII